MCHSAGKTGSCFPDKRVDPQYIFRIPLSHMRQHCFSLMCGVPVSGLPNSEGRLSMSKPNRLQKGKVQTICRIGIMTALYVLLNMLSIRAGNLHITFSSLPVIVMALLFGPLEAAAVALLGELLNQMLYYGFTATTILWLIPPAVRGLIIGAFAYRLWKTRRPLETRHILYYVVCVCAAVCTTTCNTVVIWIDSLVYHYYSFPIVFGDAAVRFVTGMISAVVISTIALPLVHFLQHQHLVRHAREIK